MTSIIIKDVIMSKIALDVLPLQKAPTNYKVARVPPNQKFSHDKARHIRLAKTSKCNDNSTPHNHTRK